MLIWYIHRAISVFISLFLANLLLSQPYAVSWFLLWIGCNPKLAHLTCVFLFWYYDVMKDWKIIITISLVTAMVPMKLLEQKSIRGYLWQKNVLGLGMAWSLTIEIVICFYFIDAERYLAGTSLRWVWLVTNSLLKHTNFKQIISYCIL